MTGSLPNILIGLSLAILLLLDRLHVSGRPQWKTRLQFGLALGVGALGLASLSQSSRFLDAHTGMARFEAMLALFFLQLAILTSPRPFRNRRSDDGPRMGNGNTQIKGVLFDALAYLGLLLAAALISDSYAVSAAALLRIIQAEWAIHIVVIGASFISGLMVTLAAGGAIRFPGSSGLIASALIFAALLPTSTDNVLSESAIAATAFAAGRVTTGWLRIRRSLVH